MRSNKESLRMALNQVSRDRLIDVCEKLGLPVPNRRDKVPAIDALIAHGYPTNLDAVFSHFNREELNDVCKKLVLSSAGTDNGPIVRRIVEFLTDPSDVEGVKAPTPEAVRVGDRVFIGHGRSPMWFELRIFLTECWG